MTSLFLIFGLFQGWQNFFEDLLLIPKIAPDEILIVKIDEESLKTQGDWPWPREKLAKMISKINQAEPKIIGVDIQISAQSRFGQTDDLILAETLKNLSSPAIFTVSGSEVVIIDPQKPLIKNFQPAFEEIKQYAKFGHSHLVADSRGLIREVPVGAFVSEDEGIFAFSFYVFQRAYQKEISKKVLEKNLVRINYTVPPGGFRAISAKNLLDEDINPQIFKNKIVLIGATAPSLQDVRSTPLGRGELMAGVEIQANIISMFLRNNFLNTPSYFLRIISLFVSALLASLIFFVLKTPLKSILMSLSFGILIFLLLVFSFSRGVVLDSFYILLSFSLSLGGNLTFKLLFEERKRKFLERTFSKYVSTEVLKEILAQDKDIVLGGKEMQITVLFTDIRSFTSISEKLSAQEVVHFLNEYFEKLTNIVTKYRGTIDKYIGDAIMAFWGAPLFQENHSDLALTASREIIEELEELNKSLEEKNLPRIKIGIGIARGLAVVGNIGSKKHFNYTAIGDVVNVASRLEGLTKFYNTPVLISDNVKNNLSKNFEVEEVGEVEIRGRQEKCRAWKFKDF